MPRRSIWKGSFVDAFLLRMKKKFDLTGKFGHVDQLLFCRKPYEFTMDLFVVRSLKEVRNLESLLLNGREQILEREEEKREV